MQTRRVTRCRTDDYSSATNSVNPSPKKQPRLNIPSPSETQWNSNNRLQPTDDESTRKRSKVEDRQYNLEDLQTLSDIQFIDCITPEHTISNPNTIYACAQVHNPPSSKRSSIFDETVEQRNQLKAMSTKDRYSNPENNHADQKDNKDGRFSYPGMGEKFIEEKKYICRFPINADTQSTVSENDQQSGSSGRHSFSDIKNSRRNTQSNINLVLTSSSTENIKRNESEYSKLSIPTPSSPSKSPRYSLLVGETSSENSSSLNTPVYEMDVSSTIGQFDLHRHNESKNASRIMETKDSNYINLAEDNENNVNI